MRRFYVPLVFILAPALAAATAAGGQHPHQGHQHHHEGEAPERLGTVEFETSCDPAVAPAFNRGVALLHSFWFPAAIEAFRGVLEQDPRCAMAHWGIALSQWGNPFGGARSPRTLDEGLATVQQARAAGPGTARERAYIAAVEALYRDHAAVDHRTRTVAYEKAMAQLHARYPDDTEGAIFYALALIQTAPLTDKTYANQLKAAPLLERAFRDHPDHPGIAHYIIHAYDAPPLAERALEAARRYAQIAPSAPHALHMPSHTFTRVGYWQESIDSNEASAEAARRADSIGEVLHAYDYQVYAYLQMARDAEAREVLSRLDGLSASLEASVGYGPAGFYALAAIPARYALERHAWREAAALDVRATGMPQADAILHFARALGAARSGRPADARPDLERLAVLRDELEHDAYWAEQVEIQRQVAAAWVTFAEGRKEDGVTALRKAADLEDATEKSAISPGPIAPARELLGEMLLEADRPAEALTVFEASMQKEPNRFRNTYGAAQAAARRGEAARARAYFEQLLGIGGAQANANRTEIRKARQFVGHAH